MGLFTDAFHLGAGAKLGTLCVEKPGYALGYHFATSSVEKAYEEYRSRYFDPVVRDDLNHIMILGTLPERENPFQEGSGKGLERFVQDHKIFCISGLLTFVLGILNSILPLNDLLTIAGVVFTISFIGMMFNIFRWGKVLLGGGVRKQLDEDGKQYWYVREYLRQALANGEIKANDAVVKLSNTRLAQQFPDTAEEIDANLFYFRNSLTQQK